MFLGSVALEVAIGLFMIHFLLAMDSVAKFGLPLSWNGCPPLPEGNPGFKNLIGCGGIEASSIQVAACFWLAKLAGLLITVSAVSLGAPFWFDMLNKLVNLRLAGAKK